MSTKRRYLIPTLLSLAVMVSPPAIAGADEDAVTRSLDAFRGAQIAADGATLSALCAPEVSYSHSSGKVEDRSTFVANATAGKSKFLSLEYRDPKIRVVGNAAVVRFNWVGEQQSTSDGSKTATNLHILMVWQKQGDEWKLIARGATKL